MNTREYINALDCYIDVIRDGRFHEVAVRDSIAQQSYRIFTEGRNSAGSGIGEYDTKRPIYVNPDKAPRKTSGVNIQGLLPTQGKTGNTVFRSGKKHKTRYVESYAKFRELIGLQAGAVKLLLFGNLKSDFENGGRGTGIIPLKLDNHRYAITLDGENEKKKQGLEKKYGDVFALTKDEIEKLSEVGEKELIIELERCSKTN
jgi:hypothetical protein